MQETGRARRDGLPTEAVLYNVPLKEVEVFISMKKYCKNTAICLRQILLAHFIDNVESECTKTKCLCCDVCDIKIINPLNLQFLQGVCENVWGTCKRGYGIHRLLPQPHEADVYQPPHMVLLMMHSCDLRVQPHI